VFNNKVTAFLLFDNICPVLQVSLVLYRNEREKHTLRGKLLVLRGKRAPRSDICVSGGQVPNEQNDKSTRRRIYGIKQRTFFTGERRIIE
jgi:hypothetical protein